ncbi:TIGR02466 family protein [Oceanibacterium hippocampi]|uniref:Fe2OG dioxygenase domain-containing protein n=1 Tax=Oceanibacterium hippocampi TaxID=745714 RepID=A0A1Y5SAV3_9PROT|nr:TIGR02466 family protein [Oceanibacterium hippocampi]SLN36195.1 hypothetical protein OCH7691_01452 [Oceanibacterium hippocampi]
MSADQTKVQLQPLFATPLAIAEIAGHVALNRALSKIVMARMASHPSTQHSNIGGWQSTWDLLDWGGEPAAQLIGEARKLVDRLTVNREGRPAQVDWTVNAWANVNESGHGNEPHTHPGSMWSGAYYVDDGGIGSDPSLGGEFEVHDPRGVAPAMYAPLLTYNAPGGASAGAVEQVRPRAGLMFLFPAWLSHGVRPYRGRARRISIAFNFSL